MKRIPVMICLIFALAVITTGCRDRLSTDSVLSGGEPVGVGDLESIRESVLMESETEGASWDGTVYWIDGGSSTVYHTHADCSYLEDKRIASGKLTDAYAASRTKLCSRCAKRDGNDAEE